MSGIEFDYSTQLSDSLSLQIGGNYINAELTSDQPEAASGEDRGFDGDKIPNVPELQGFASLIYDTSTRFGELSMRADLNYRDSTNTRFDIQSANNVALSSSVLVNRRASLTFLGGWYAAIYVKNLTDEVALFDGISSNQDPLALIAARPRTIGLNVRKDF